MNVQLYYTVSIVYQCVENIVELVHGSIKRRAPAWVPARGRETSSNSWALFYKILYVVLVITIFEYKKVNGGYDLSELYTALTDGWYSFS